MPGQLGSATINAVDNVRHSEAYQEPIGATNVTDPVTLINGTIGGGFAAVDVTELFPITNPGYSAAGAFTAPDALYVVADVPVTAGAAAVTVAAGHITVATGGTYTSPKALAAGEYGWVYLT